MSRVVILGAGPAGISAALYTVRAGIETTVIHKGSEGSALYKAHSIENYYGFAQPLSGRELYENGIAGAKRLGVRFVEDEAVALEWNGSFSVETLQGRYDADAVIIALGAERADPRIPGTKDFEGRGVSWCAVCDAFFFRGKDVAVLGDGEYAVHEAKLLARTSGKVTILTNGKPLQAEKPVGIDVIETPVEKVEGGFSLQKICLKDGTELPAAGLFIALGTAGSVSLARKIGAMVEGSRIVVDEHGATNVPGLYAAGDCTGGTLQVSKAVWDGANAGLQVISYLKK
jgi:thioredoxin reductase (NADPH)